jgi:hypothetical protein
VNDPGLAFVGGDDDDLGALGAGQQLIEGEHGGEAALALPSWQHPPGQPRPGLHVPGRGDQGTLPGPQTQRPADTMAAGHPYEVGGEPRNR